MWKGKGRIVVSVSFRVNIVWPIFELFVFRVLSKLWGHVYGNGQHPCHPQQLPSSKGRLQSDPRSRKVSQSVWPFPQNGSVLVYPPPTPTLLPLFWCSKITPRCHQAVLFLLGQHCLKKHHHKLLFVCLFSFVSSLCSTSDTQVVIFKVHGWTMLQRHHMLF